MKIWNKTVVDSPVEAEIQYNLTFFPGVGQVIVVDACFIGDAADLEKVLGELYTYGTPIMKVVRKEEYYKKQQSGDHLVAYGGVYYNKDMFFDWSDEAVDPILTQFEKMPVVPWAFISILPMGGAIRNKDFVANSAWGHRQAEFLAATIVNYEMNKQEELFEWVRNYLYKSSAFSGIYTNTEEIPSEETSKLAYTKNLPRLRELKMKYDPDNVFRFNYNIAI